MLLSGRNLPGTRSHATLDERGQLLEAAELWHQRLAEAYQLHAQTSQRLAEAYQLHAEACQRGGRWVDRWADCFAEATEQKQQLFMTKLQLAEAIRRAENAEAERDQANAALVQLGFPEGLASFIQMKSSTPSSTNLASRPCPPATTNTTNTTSEQDEVSSESPNNSGQKGNNMGGSIKKRKR